MNKAELIDLVVKEADVSKKDADTIVFATVGAIMESIAGSDEVSLIGFGSFEPRARKARDGRNPQTGKTIKIPGTVRIVVSTQEDFTEGGLERLRNSNKARSGLSTQIEKSEGVSQELNDWERSSYSFLSVLPHGR